jgi:hypothetical protein
VIPKKNRRSRTHWPLKELLGADKLLSLMVPTEELKLSLPEESRKLQSLPLS